MTAHSVTLEKTANIQQVGRLAADWKQRVEDGTTAFTIDATGTERIDTAMLQLLIALKGELQERGGGLELKLSPAALTNVRLLGLETALGLGG